MTELNDLFEQIFHSEMHFKARADHLKRVKQKIEACQLKLDQTKELLHTNQGELAVKNSKLANVEMEVKLLLLRKDIFQNQKNDIIKQNKRTQEEYQSVVDELALQRQLFRERLKEFSCCYDLHGSGLKYREEEDKKKLGVLNDELILLETELVEIGSYQEDMKKLEVELHQAEEKLQQEKNVEKELKAEQSEQEELIGRMRKEKASASNMSNNPDLKRLQFELDVCKNSPEEEECKKLSKELERLQKESYHKQIKLQVERQSKTSSRNYSSHQQTPQPDCEAESSHQDSETLEDEDWYEASMLNEFDSDGDMEDGWDLDESELEHSLASMDANIDDAKKETVLKNKGKDTKRNFPPSSFNTAGKYYGSSSAGNDFQPAASLSSSATSTRALAASVQSRFSPPPSSSNARQGRIKLGKSSFKSESNISNTKVAKKVRFHY